MRDLLVHVSRYDRWSNSLQYAGRLGGWLKAAVTAVCCLDSAGEAAHSPGSRQGPGADADRGTEPTADPSAAARGMAEPFACFMASLGVPHSDWIVHEGSPVPVLAHLGHWHDLLVLGADGVSGPHPHSDLARTLLVSQLTCLVVPEAWTSTKPANCIAVAWDGTVSAVRALHAAVPLLEGASRVVLLMDAPGEAHSLEPHMPPFDLDRFCQRHELRFERIEVTDGGSAHAGGARLLGTALVAGAEMLVLGASGRTRMSERLLDEADSEVLLNSPIPLLLRH